jgi:hypothetical protein
MDFKILKKLIFGKFLGFHRKPYLDDSSRKMEVNPLDWTPKQARTTITRRIKQLVKQRSKFGGWWRSTSNSAQGGVWEAIRVLCVLWILNK